MNDLAPVSDIARTIQLTIAPVFLLAGIGAFLNVIAGRLNRVVDRSRHIEQLHPESTGPEHERHVWELRLLDRRISLASNAIFLCVASGVTVCLLVTMLFVAEIAHFNYGRAIMLLFVIAMGLLAVGLILFLIETRVAVGGIQVREDLLETRAKAQVQVLNVLLEKRVLQAVVATACLVPLFAGPSGVLRGAAWMAHGPVSPDLDSHFRYMSGIFTGVGLAFVSCIPRIEAKGHRMRMLVGFVVLGGLARLFSWAQIGPPDRGNQFGLVMELCVTPLLGLWQWRFSRRYPTGSSGAGTVAA